MARTKEGKASDAIRAALALEPGLALYRNSVGLFKANGCVTRAGLGGANRSKRTKGAADTIGTLAIRVMFDERDVDGRPTGDSYNAIIGRAIALEIKAPGEELFTLEQTRERCAKYGARKLPAALQHELNQALWAQEWRELGAGFYAQVRDEDEARAAIARARAGALE
jgi:hypothetical protein